MIKYTILYKNGKTWNGKAKGIANIPVIPCILLVIHCKDGAKKLYYMDGYSWEHFEEMNPSHVYERTPNPKSKTKKQKAFDKAYAKWVYDMGELNDGKRGNLDFSVKAYKKWLFHQRLEKPLTEVAGALPEYKVALYTNGAPQKITFPSGASVSFHDSKDVLKGCKECYVSHEPWDGVYKPWKEAKLSIPDYPLPIKTTYSFWLGAFGEVADV